MLDLLKFSNNERLYILAVLFSMPWCSASNIVAVSTFSEASINRHLRTFESEGIAFPFSMGRLLRRQTRWCLTGYGVGLATDVLGSYGNRQHSGAGLTDLADRLDTFEAIYSLLPKVLADEVPRHLQCGSIRVPVDDGCDLTLRHHVPTGRERDGVVVFSDKAVLSGFALVGHETVIALAEYAVLENALAGTNLSGYSDMGLVRRVVLPIVKYGPHLHSIKLNLLSDLYSGLETVPQGVRVGDTTIRYPASPPGLVIVVDDLFDSVAADRNFAPGLSALVVGVDGTRFKSMKPDYQYGTVNVPHRPVDIGKPEDVTSKLAKNPMLPEKNGQLFWRLFKTITREGLVTESELIARFGPSNERSVRTALRSLSDAKMVTKVDDLYELSDPGANYWGRVYGDPIGITELMTLRSCFNAERFESKTRQDKIIAMADRLKSDGLLVRLGWELGPPLDERDGWSLHATPDLWVVSEGVDNPVLYAFHYVDEAGNLSAELRDGGYYRKAYDRLRNEPYRQWLPLLVVGEDQAILDEIRVAGLDLPMATTTVTALLDRGVHRGGRSTWYYGTVVADIDIDQLPWRFPMPEAPSAPAPEPAPQWGRLRLETLKDQLASALSESGLTVEFAMQELLTGTWTSCIGIVMRVRPQCQMEPIGPEVVLRVRFASLFGAPELRFAAKDVAADSDNFDATLAVCADQYLRQLVPLSLDDRPVATATLDECARGPHVGPYSIWRCGDQSLGIDQFIQQSGRVKSRLSEYPRSSQSQTSVNDQTPSSREGVRTWFLEEMRRNWPGA